MTIQEVKSRPTWARWAGIGGKIPWEPNKADVIQGVIAEHSPVKRQSFKPRNITEEPLTDVASHYERSNTARPKRHHFESPLFHWLPSFRDFRTKQVSFAQKDLTKQRDVAADLFIRTQAFNHAPHVAVARRTGELVDTSLASGEATPSNTPKSLSALATLVQSIGFENIGYLDYRQIVAIRSAFRRTIGAQPMDGYQGKPSDNEVTKGKYLLMGEPELYENMQFDTHLLANRVLTRDLVNSDFKGVIAENILFREECYPHRLAVAADGTISEPEPEIEQLLPSTGYGSDARYETVPNPAFVNAAIGVAYFIGGDAWEDMAVGAPPSEFSGGKMASGDFGKLNWNGEMRVIKPTILSLPGGVYTSNDYGGWLKIICDTTFGYMPKTSRNILPVLYRRDKYPSLRLS